MPIVLVLALYGIVFLAAVVAGVLGLIAGPRHWSRRLCKWSLWTSGIFLTLLAAALVCLIVLAAAGSKIAIAPILMFAFVVCAPLLVAFFALFLIWKCRVSPPCG